MKEKLPVAKEMLNNIGITDDLLSIISTDISELENVMKEYTKKVLDYTYEHATVRIHTHEDSPYVDYNRQEMMNWNRGGVIITPGIRAYEKVKKELK